MSNRESRESVKLAGTIQTNGSTNGPAQELVEEQDSPVNRVNQFSRGLQMSKPEWPYFMVGSVAAVFTGLVNPTFGFLVIQVLRIYFDEDKGYVKSQVAIYSIAFLCLGVGLVPLYFTQHYCFGLCGERLVMRVRQKMFAGSLNMYL